MQNRSISFPISSFLQNFSKFTPIKFWTKFNLIISILSQALREYYEGYLDSATRLSDPQNLGDPQELEKIRTTCVKWYLLYLVGCLLFGDKSNKRIELVYLTTMEDGYAGMRNHSWGGMTLAYLYHCLSEVSLPGGGALERSVTLVTAGWFLCHLPERGLR
ncbi:uncharacterized protein [Medicago truncatula]|uniref:uncharacterized protein isoform X2 n=1 Tax=Medicago truncatula TaxID=3880 RepID=UPI000D2F361C|nr:uncharacterized protein LOC25488614 isoform X2 [Medicago truncatula]